MEASAPKLNKGNFVHIGQLMLPVPKLIFVYNIETVTVIFCLGFNNHVVSIAERDLGYHLAFETLRD